MVARGGRHGALRRRRELCRVPVELGRGPIPERLVGPVLPADRDELKVVAQFTGCAQSRESRQEITRGEVTGRPEYGQLPNHVLKPACARASVTPLAITPMWLKACGKLPVNSPVDGSICSDSRPSGLARAQSEP